MNKIHLTPSVCVLCGGSPASEDTLGIPWCEEHQNRRRLMNAGVLRRFPAVPGKYAIASGVLHWCMTALYASDASVQELRQRVEEAAS